LQLDRARPHINKVLNDLAVMCQCPSADPDSCRYGALLGLGVGYLADNCQTEANNSYAYDTVHFHFLSFDPVVQVVSGVCRQFASV
jgi:hypothetical protein